MGQFLLVFLCMCASVCVQTYSPSCWSTAMILASGSVRDPGSSPGQTSKLRLHSSEHYMSVHTATVMDGQELIFQHSCFNCFKWHRNNQVLIQKKVVDANSN